MQFSTQEQLDRNYVAFVAVLPELLATHEGGFALMHNGLVGKFSDNPVAAVEAGLQAYPDGSFTIQKIARASMNLGYFSNGLAPKIS